MITNHLLGSTGNYGNLDLSYNDSIFYKPDSPTCLVLWLFSLQPLYILFYDGTNVFFRIILVTSIVVKGNINSFVLQQSYKQAETKQNHP